MQNISGESPLTHDNGQFQATLYGLPCFEKFPTKKIVSKSLFDIEELPERDEKKVRL